MTIVTPETLDAAVETESPFRLTPSGGGTATFERLWNHPNGSNVYAPDVTATDNGGVTVDGNDWEPVDGHSGQHGYSGPIMHPSETLSGGMARRVVEEGGVYVVVEVLDNTDHLDPDSDYDAIVDTRDNPAGWALMRYTGDAL